MEWSEHFIKKMNVQQISKEAIPLTKLLHTVSNSKTKFATDILRYVLNKNKILKNELSKLDNESISKCETIVKSTRQFITDKLGNAQRKEEKEALYAIFNAYTYNVEKPNIVHNMIGFSKKNLLQKRSGGK